MSSTHLVLSQQTPTLLDYGQVLLSLLPLERLTVHLFSYLCELTLLYSALTTYSSAHLANATLLLTRALHHYGKVGEQAVYGCVPNGTSSCSALYRG